MNNTNDDITKQILTMVKEKKMDKEFALELLKRLMNVKENESPKKIAIIGISFRFPEGDNLEEYWKLLMDEKNVIGRFPNERRGDLTQFMPLNVFKKEPYMHGGFLKDIATFDADFFGISNEEAIKIDPVQRMFLKTAYEALEDGGYGGNEHNGHKTGVFAGIDQTYRSSIAYNNFIRNQDFMTMTGAKTAILASRISYCLNFTGPAEVIDTACSSAAVAIHRACKALKNKECSMAIAGGVNLFLMPLKGRTMMAEIEATDDMVRPFDNKAGGLIWSEGVGSVLLKPLDDAVRDGDNIYAVIAGSAVNNNGKSANNITAINTKAIKSLLLEAWKDAGVKGTDLSYIEAHGTGSLVGDAMEVNGINGALREFTSEKHICGIGSVKGNVGHMAACSTIGSLAKVILSMKNKKIPANINFSEPNESVDFNQSAVYVVDKLTDWKCEKDKKRIAGINSFSFSGANCHLVIEEAPSTSEQAKKESEECNRIFTISAKKSTPFHKLVEAYQQLLDDNTDIDFESLCYSSSMSRGHYEYRLAIIAKNVDELKVKLAKFKDAVYAHSDEASMIYYGEHRLTGANHKQNAGDLTEGDCRSISKFINEKIEKTLEDKESYTEQLLIDVCHNYVTGAKINWNVFYRGDSIKKTRLPIYPLEPTKYWVSIIGDNQKK